MRVLYFAWVKEKVGVTEEEIQPPDGVVTIAQLIDWLKARGPEFADAFAKSEVICVAIDQIHIRHDAKIAGAREIAFFPPVTGG